MADDPKNLWDKFGIITAFLSAVGGVGGIAVSLLDNGVPSNAPSPKKLEKKLDKPNDIAKLQAEKKIALAQAAKLQAEKKAALAQAAKLQAEKKAAMAQAAKLQAEKKAAAVKQAKKQLQKTEPEKLIQESEKVIVEQVLKAIAQ